MAENIENNGCSQRDNAEHEGYVKASRSFNPGEETHYIYPNGDEVYNVEIIYICRKYHGTIKRQEEEVEELKFFDVDDIPEDISDPIRPVFREYIKMRKRE